MDPTKLLARLPGRVRNALLALRGAGAAAYVVGGAPRDLLAGRTARDYDLSTDADETTLAALFPDAQPYGRFGTIRLADDIELTRFRADGPYGDRRRPDSVRFGVGIAEDLARRDFTLNAVAIGYPAGGGPVELVDPTGGAKDLAAGRLRAIGDPADRLAEDPLRILRAHRIASAFGFQLDPATHRAMRQHADLLAFISPIRIGIEVARGLRSAHPRELIEGLAADGALEHVFPGVVLAPATLDAVSRLPGHDPELRLAALLRGAAPEVCEAVYARTACSREQRRRIEELVTPLPARLAPAAARDRVARIGRVQAVRLARLLRAFPDGSAPAKVIETVCNDRSAIGRAELSIPAAEIAESTGLAGGALGELIGALVAAVHADPSLNEPRQLRTLLRDFGRVFGH
jgi:tRNA nucleotidyltransferase/poly(A) polymerase